LPARGDQSRLGNIDITTIVTGNGPGLGIRTGRSVLDVASAERSLRQGLPTPRRT
jgi:hypothetical protein